MQNLIPSSPIEILSKKILDNISILDEHKIKFLHNVIDTGVKINEYLAIGLASAFATEKEPVTKITVDFWLNTQKQWDEYNKIDLLSDPAVEFKSSLAAFKHIAFNGSPVYLSNVIDNQPFNIYLISEQAYKYIIKHFTEDDKWDLGWLGCSEEHSRKVEMPEALKRLIVAKKQEQLKNHIG